MQSALARELKENSAYLRDSGFQSTATLMEIAANEIEWLSARIADLERREARNGRLILPGIARLFGF
jgi:hypothetical protein